MSEEEFRRRLNKIEEEILDIKSTNKSMSTKIATIETNDAVATVHRENVEKRLDAIENTLQWLVRLIIGAILLAMIAFVLGGGISNVQ